MYLAKCYGLPRAWPCRSKIGPWRPRQRRLLRLLGGGASRDWGSHRLKVPFEPHEPFLSHEPKDVAPWPTGDER